METKGPTTTKIARVEATPVQLPARRDWSWRGLQSSVGRLVIVEVHTEDGLVGLGEADPVPEWGGDYGRYGGETQESVAHVIERFLAPALSGVDPFDVERSMGLMDDAISGHFSAKAALEIALRDLQGKIARQPIYRLLGGRSRAGVKIAHTIGVMTREDAMEEARAVIAEGLSAFHVKGTGELKRDLSVVTAVRETIGDDAYLSLDANSGYRKRGTKEVINALRALVAAGADTLEQPTEGLREMAEVRAALDVTLIADESAAHLKDLMPIVEGRAADAISIYVLNGGISNAQKMAIFAEACGLGWNAIGAFVGGIANAACLHFATAVRGDPLPSPIPITAPADLSAFRTAGRYFSDDVVSEPFVFEDGVLRPPDGPGLGVELDRAKLEKYRVHLDH